ncbi:MAG: CocE/NonD family hydrolase [Thermodesulfobacteriota bacterium]
MGAIRLRARPCGQSRGGEIPAGRLDPFSPRETRDLYEAVEWAGKQPWSNGKVGMSGISYYSINQWLVASRQLPHLAAIAPWEDAADMYRDVTRQGGIFSNTFPMLWFQRQVLPVQYGNGQSQLRDLDDGAPIGGERSLAREQLAASWGDLVEEILRRPLDGPWYRERRGDFSKINVPLLSGAHWGGMGLHCPGNFEGSARSVSRRKWLEVHGGKHRDAFYSEETQALLKEFFDHFLNGEADG